MTATRDVRSSDRAHVPSSSTPGFSHLSIRRRTRLSPIRCSRNRICHAGMAASRTHYLSPLEAHGQGSSASCCERSGRKP
jgi:hypothetical protein